MNWFALLHELVLQVDNKNEYNYIPTMMKQKKFSNIYAQDKSANMHTAHKSIVEVLVKIFEIYLISVEVQYWFSVVYIRQKETVEN